LTRIAIGDILKWFKLFNERRISLKTVVSANAERIKTNERQIL
jgi:hypothetical protein